MGYHTEFFESKLKLNKPLTKKLQAFLVKFNETRRMKRDMTKLFDKEKAATFGLEGEFYVDGVGFMGQDHDASVVDGNAPPSTQPGLWCQWRPSEDGQSIVWDEGEKFYYYAEWLQYICDSFLAPKGYILSGSVRFQGEEPSDAGWVVCEKNKVRIEDTKFKPIPQKCQALTKTVSKRAINWQ